MAKSPADKLAAKREALLQRTADALGITQEDALALLNIPRRQSLRLNPLKGDPEETLAELLMTGWQGSPVAWAPNGYHMASAVEDIRDHPAVTTGKAFIQNAASWLPVLMLEPQPTDEILDVCAAPGGKTSHIAAISNNQARITANDNSRPRLAKMRANFERLGVQNIETTLFDSQYLAKKLEGREFDRILLDAPCSGEGMMRYDHDKDFTTWSVAQIKRLQQLQKQILNQSWRLLKPGGTLVYSTCTMAPEENEAVIDYLLRTHEDAKLVPISMELPNKTPVILAWNTKRYSPDLMGCLRLKPSPDIEAFFVARITKKV